MSSRNMRLLPWAALRSDSEQLSSRPINIIQVQDLHLIPVLNRVIKGLLQSLMRNQDIWNQFSPSWFDGCDTLGFKFPRTSCQARRPTNRFEGLPMDHQAERLPAAPYQSSLIPPPLSAGPESPHLLFSQ
jgi:hypothetical protein